MAEQAKGDGKEHMAHHAAVLLKVTQTMARRGIAPFPRNYELFYEALSGRNRALTKDVAALGAQPAQGQLEAIGAKYHLPGFAATTAHTAEAISKATGILTETLAKKKALVDLLQDIQPAFSAEASEAVGAAAREETAAIRMLNEAVKQLGALKSTMGAAQNLTLLDPVTGLPNRLAFSAKVGALFEEGQAPSPAALSLVTVDGLRAIGERHGAAVAEKVLKKLAPLFRKSIKKDDFVARIGVEEFAFIFHNVSIENAEAIARRIRASVEEMTLTLPNRAATSNMLSLFTGMAMSPAASGTTDLFIQAELALRAVRSGGKPGILFSSSSIDKQKKPATKSNAA